MSDWITWHAPYSGWLVMAVAALAGLWLIFHGLRRRPARAGICVRCGYDVHASPTPVCPECGHARHPNDLRPRRWAMAAAGLLLAVALPVFVVQYRVRDYGWSYYTIVGPLYWLLPDRTVESFRYGDYEARLTLSRRRFIDFTPYTLTLYRNGRKVDSVQDDYVTIGVAEFAMPGGPAMDLDNDGTPELVIESNGGGNSGYYDVSLFTLPAPGGPPPRLIRVGGARIVGFTKDVDGRWLIEAIEWVSSRTMRGQYLPTLMHYTNQRLEYAVDAMCRRPPAETEAGSYRTLCRSWAKQGGPLTPTLADAYDGILLDLISVGRSNEAYRFLDDTWAGTTAEKDKYLHDFRDALRQTLPADVLQKLGHPPLL